MSRELLQQCLNKFEHLWEIGIDAHYRVDLTPDIRALREELAKPEQKGISSGLCLHPSALNYLDKKKVRTRLDYQPYTGVGEALEKELGESNEP